jgi:tetratricopeptide (TPR) repeat protein
VRIAVIAAFAASLLIGVATPSPAAAQEDATSSQDEDPARAEYQLGVDAYSAGRYREAVEHFEATHRLAPNPVLSYNIALAYDAMGAAANALRYYRDYLRAAPEAEDRNEVLASIRRLEKRLADWGVQQLTVMSTPSGAQLSVDGQSVGRTPWTGELTPNGHRVVVELTGYTPTTVDVTLSPDRAMDVTVALQTASGAAVAPAAEPAAVPPPSTPPPSSSPPPRRPNRGPDPLALGALSLGVGSFVGALLLERSRADAEADAVVAPTQVAAAAELDTIARRRTAARVMTGVGFGLVATSATLFIVHRRARQAEQRPSATLTAACAPTDCALLVSGRLP